MTPSRTARNTSGLTRGGEPPRPDSGALRLAAVDDSEGVYSDPIPELADVEAEAQEGQRQRDRNRHAAAACDAWGVPASPHLFERLIGLAWKGHRRDRRDCLPQLAEGVEEMCLFALWCHGIDADPVLAWRLGVLAGRAP